MQNFINKLLYLFNFAKALNLIKKYWIVISIVFDSFFSYGNLLQRASFMVLVDKSASDE